jgi:hypothetical protein
MRSPVTDILIHNHRGKKVYPGNADQCDQHQCLSQIEGCQLHGTPPFSLSRHSLPASLSCQADCELFLFTEVPYFKPFTSATTVNLWK